MRSLSNVFVGMRPYVLAIAIGSIKDGWIELLPAPRMRRIGSAGRRSENWFVINPVCEREREKEIAKTSVK